jgi:hypothetical protein
MLPGMAGYRFGLWLATVCLILGGLGLIGALSDRNILGVVSSIIVVWGSYSMIRGLRRRIGLRYDARHS